MKDYFIGWLKRLCYVFTAMTIVWNVIKVIQGKETIVVPKGQVAYLFYIEDIQDCEEYFRDGCSVLLKPNNVDNY